MRPKTRGSPTNVAAAAGPPKLCPSSLTRIHLAPFVSERKIPWTPLYVPQTKMDGYALAVLGAPTATVVTLVSLAALPLALIFLQVAPKLVEWYNAVG